MAIRLRDLLRQLKSLQGTVPPGLIHDVLAGITLLVAWQSVRHPTHAVRDAMTKHACKVWRVPRKRNKVLRPHADIAAELEGHLVSAATGIVEGSVAKHVHWQLLHKSVHWVEEQCLAAPSELGTEELNTMLAGFRSWLVERKHSNRELRDKSYARERNAMREELAAIVAGELIRLLP